MQSGNQSIDGVIALTMKTKVMGSFCRVKVSRSNNGAKAATVRYTKKQKSA